MSHIAQQVRQAVGTALTGLTTTGARVYVNRTDATPLHDGEYPGLIVTGGGEDIANADLGGDTLQRDMRIKVSVLVKVTDNVEDQLDDIRSEVETALAPRLLLDVGSVQLLYTGMSDPEIDESLDQAVMAADLNFSYTVFTSRNAPDLQL